LEFTLPVRAVINIQFQGQHGLHDAAHLIETLYLYGI
jgi:hypothetical protein